MQIREKEEAKKTTSSSTWNHDLTKYVVTDASGHTTKPLAKRRAVLRLAHALVEAGVPAQVVAAVIPGKKARWVPGVTSEADEDTVAEALETAHPNISDTGRWFTEAPLFADGGAWIVTTMWGIDSLPTLTSMVELAPGSGVRFAAVPATLPTS